MKRLLPALTLALLLTACSVQSPADSPAPSALTLSAGEVAQAVLETATFSETLEEVELSVACGLYGLEEADVVACAAYLSTGATAEECTILVMKDEETAQTALEGFQTRVNDQIEALTDYQPAEIPKLEQATYGTRSHQDGTLVYLVVAQDMAGVFEAIGS